MSDWNCNFTETRQMLDAGRVLAKTHSDSKQL